MSSEYQLTDLLRTCVNTANAGTMKRGAGENVQHGYPDENIPSARRAHHGGSDRRVESMKYPMKS